jgi:hypothetical protein
MDECVLLLLDFEVGFLLECRQLTEDLSRELLPGLTEHRDTFNDARFLEALRCPLFVREVNVDGRT